MSACRVIAVLSSSLLVFLTVSVVTCYGKGYIDDYGFGSGSGSGSGAGSGAGYLSEFDILYGRGTIMSGAPCLVLLRHNVGHGRTWPYGDCSTCECNSDVMECTLESCTPYDQLPCPESERNKGKCCWTCDPDKVPMMNSSLLVDDPPPPICWYNMQTFEVGAEIYLGDCYSCTCAPGAVIKCLVESCPRPQCHNPVPRDGACCPVCPHHIRLNEMSPWIAAGHPALKAKESNTIRFNVNVTFEDGGPTGVAGKNLWELRAWLSSRFYGKPRYGFSQQVLNQAQRSQAHVLNQPFSFENVDFHVAGPNRLSCDMMQYLCVRLNRGRFASTHHPQYYFTRWIHTHPTQCVRAPTCVAENMDKTTQQIFNVAVRKVLPSVISDGHLKMGTYELRLRVQMIFQAISALPTALRGIKLWALSGWIEARQINEIKSFAHSEQLLETAQQPQTLDEETFALDDVIFTFNQSEPGLRQGSLFVCVRLKMGADVSRVGGVDAHLSGYPNDLALTGCAPLTNNWYTTCAPNTTTEGTVTQQTQTETQTETETETETETQTQTETQTETQTQTQTQTETQTQTQTQTQTHPQSQTMTQTEEPSLQVDQASFGITSSSLSNVLGISAGCAGIVVLVTAVSVI